MKKSLPILIFLLIALDSLSQDVSFSHLNHSKLHINPGFAGSNKVSDVVLTHRNFSPAGFGNYMTYRASINQYFEWMNGGLALEFMRDDQGKGAISRTYLSGMYAYKLQLKNNLVMQPALQVKYAYYSLNTSELVFPAMFDPSSWQITDPSPPIAGRNDQYLEFNTGFILVHRNEYLRTYRDWTLGVSVRHLNRPFSFLEAETRIPRQWILYFDMEIFLRQLETYRSSTVLTPTLYYSYHDNESLFHYGAYLRYKNIRVGAFLRHNLRLEYLTPAFQVGTAFENFHIDYSYDAGFLNYKRTSVFSGAHEVTLSINFSIRGRGRQ